MAEIAVLRVVGSKKGRKGLVECMRLERGEVEQEETYVQTQVKKAKVMFDACSILR